MISSGKPDHSPTPTSCQAKNKRSKFVQSATPWEGSSMESDSVGVERRRLPFTLIENVVLEDQELGPVDVLVYLALAKHADGDGVCWPSMSTIGKLARCARETVARSIT